MFFVMATFQKIPHNPAGADKSEGAGGGGLMSQNALETCRPNPWIHNRHRLERTRSLQNLSQASKAAGHTQNSAPRGRRNI